jgi:cardiolipin synthase (CMP-forming)
MRGTGESAPGTSRVFTIPNLISLLRILLIPLFCLLIVDRDSSAVGIVLFAAIVATDWVDGFVARRTGQISEVGKILDPVADRLAIAAGLIALVVRGAFPLWAALLILIRDVAMLLGGAFLLKDKGVRIDVRWIGKLATFSLMMAIPLISWGTLDLPLAEAALVCGWIAFAVGIVESYIAAAAYFGDLRRVIAAG